MKTSKKAKHPTMQIVEGVREGSKVTQRTVAHLGVIKSKRDLQKLKNLADKLIQRLEAEGLEIEPKAELKKLKHEQIVYDGFAYIVDRLMNMTGFDGIIQSAQGKHQFDLLNIIKMILTQQWDVPSSKRRSHERQEEHGFQGIDIQHVYRSMDAITSLDEAIQKQAFHAAGLLDTPVDCLFFDVTTLYFESVTQDDLRDFGFSKDLQHHSVQIVFALVVDAHGLPIAYDVFRGNTAETKTLIPVLKKLRDRFSIQNVTVVCDRGLASKVNVEALQEAQFQFVIATKLRSLAKHIQINDLNAYTCMPGQEILPEEERVLFRTMDHPQYVDTRLIVTYSPRRAQKDRRDREKLVEKLHDKLSCSSSIKQVISNHGYKKYTTVQEGSEITLNAQAVEEDALWDGFHGIAVSKGSRLDASQALTRYRELWHVEETFRIAKSTLKARPIFHWAPRRIKTHLLLCFMNLFLERFLERLFLQHGASFSPDRIRYALSQVHTTVFKDQATDRTWKMQSSLTPDAEKIFNVLGLSTERVTAPK